MSKQMTRQEFDENFAKVKKLSLAISDEEKDWLLMMLAIAAVNPDTDPLTELLTAEKKAIVLPIMNKIEGLVAEEEKEKG